MRWIVGHASGQGARQTLQARLAVTSQRAHRSRLATVSPTTSAKRPKPPHLPYLESSPFCTALIGSSIEPVPQSLPLSACRRSDRRILMSSCSPLSRRPLKPASSMWVLVSRAACHRSGQSTGRTGNMDLTFSRDTHIVGALLIGIRSGSNRWRRRNPAETHYTASRPPEIHARGLPTACVQAPTNAPRGLIPHTQSQAVCQTKCSIRVLTRLTTAKW